MCLPKSFEESPVLSLPACEVEVTVPTIRLEEGEIVLQWFGETQNRDLGLQFAFKLVTRRDSVFWLGKPEWYRTMLLGSLKEEGVAFVCVVTSQIELGDRFGGSKPARMLIEVACLHDPRHGIIRPREYANWAVAREETAKLLQAA